LQQNLALPAARRQRLDNNGSMTTQSQMPKLQGIPRDLGISHCHSASRRRLAIEARHTRHAAPPGYLCRYV
jgi:hypothetical protein